MNTLLKRIAPLLGMQNPSYDDMAKARFHRLARTFLKELARTVGLQPTDYRLSVCAGGNAVAGEVQIRAPHALVMVMFNPAIRIEGPALMYRRHDGPLDGCGGQNHFVALAELASNPEAVERLVRTLSAWQPRAALAA